MVKDRLGDLKRGANDSSFELGNTGNRNSVSFRLEGLKSETDDIRTNTSKLRECVDEVERLQGKIISSAGNQDHLREELDERMEQAKKLSYKIKQDLKVMLVSINQQKANLSRNPSDKRLETNIRIQTGQYTTLTSSFSDLMQRFNRMQADYMEQSKKIIQRQLSFTGVHKTNEEIQDMIDSGNPKIFTQEIIAETKMARQALADVEARHHDILKLEKSIIELNEMFIDISEMIENQGQMVDNIESNVIQVEADVETAKIELPKAVENQRKARKKKFMVIGIIALIIIIIVILLVILLSLYLPKRN